MVLLFAGGLLWWVWYQGRPGPSVKLDIVVPSTTAILSVGKRVYITGRVRSGKGSVTCNATTVRPAHDGRFRFDIPGPSAPGLFLINCRAMNARDREYHFRFGRLAGQSVSLTAPIEDAVVMVLPLSILRDQGGVLDELSGLVDRKIRPLLNRLAGSTSLSLSGIGAGPVSVGRVEILSIDASADDQVRMKLALDKVCLDWKLGPLAGIPLPRGRGRFCLPLRIPITVRFRVGQDGRVDFSVGKLSRRFLERLAGSGPLLVAEQVSSLLSRTLGRALSWPRRAARKILREVDAARRRVDHRLSRIADMLPATPRRWPGGSKRLCWKVELSHLTANEKFVEVRFRLRLVGYALRRETCASPHVFPRAVNRVRIPQKAILPPATAPGKIVHVGRAGAILSISANLINAYSAGLWASGALARIPVDLPGLRRQGFDVRSVGLLVPAMITGAGPQQRGVWVNLPEMDVSIQTIGEPKRLFRVSASVRVKLSLDPGGKLEAFVMEHPSPLLAVRCVGQLGRPTCSSQSRRYQSMADVALALIRDGGMLLPNLTIAASLPMWQSKHLRLFVSGIRASASGRLQVSMVVKSRKK